MCCHIEILNQKYKSLKERKSKDNDKKEERMNNGGKSSIGFDDHFLKVEFLLLLFTTFKQISQMLNLMCLVIDGFRWM